MLRVAVAPLSLLSFLGAFEVEAGKTCTHDLQVPAQ